MSNTRHTLIGHDTSIFYVLFKIFRVLVCCVVSCLYQLVRVGAT